MSGTSMTPIVDERFASGPPPSRKRRIVALYLDYVLFSVPWGLGIWVLARAVPTLEGISPLFRFLLFTLVELSLLRFAYWSPGHWMLGIRRRPNPAFTAPAESAMKSARLVVDPWLHAHERWWTILFGVLAVLEGCKLLIRWTMWTPPIPFLGQQLGETASVIVLMTFGILGCAVGFAAIRLRPVVLPLAVFCYGVDLLSTLLSWDQWATWTEKYMLARRAYQGQPVREGEIELMQSLSPALMVATTAGLAVWAVLVAWRVRRARTEEPA